MEDFILQSKEDLKGQGIKEGGYCVIVYVYSGPQFNKTSNRVKFIYKSLEDFENKFNVNDIDPSRGVDVQLWVFD